MINLWVSSEYEVSVAFVQLRSVKTTTTTTRHLVSEIFDAEGVRLSEDDRVQPDREWRCSISELCYRPQV
ncbi:hypothetical protein EVAR_68468_1 [Eumeta japonica]|uniref:DUF348 domain-containing protein n=1 Tax=Eumeta variegata TaxID=151549 RepID=A0A4C2A7B1_EUMVA|nr:hypothetical protein EVAR_68468_1 [Eumeta japonica]